VVVLTVIPVVTPTDEWLTDLVAVASTSEGAKVTTALPAIAPHSVHKARIEWDTPAASEPKAVSLDVRLEERPAEGEPVLLASRTVELRTVTAESRRNETFTSRIDGSAQYYAVVPALPRESAGRPGLLLSLHGASVEASSQAAAYSAKDWATIVCPTNRRAYGFDWEDWGRLDALEVLNHAQRRFRTDPRRQWLTGHSMGGHGTWQIGAHESDRFAAIAPIGVVGHNPDFVALAQAWGARGERVGDAAQLTAALRAAQHHPGPTVIEVDAAQFPQD
jgi:hypothetical protein